MHFHWRLGIQNLLV